jgi:Lon protease-like protein
MTMSAARLDIDPALDELPLFPLPQLVFFPSARLPLHVFEPRYRALLAHCLETHRAMAVVQITDPSDLDDEGQPRIAEVAGAGIIVEHEPLADGRSNILLQGVARVRLEELPFRPPFRRARATKLVDVPSGAIASTDRTALIATAGAFAAEVKKHDASFSFSLPPNLETAQIADVCAHHLLVSHVTRRALLEELDPVVRVRRVIEELALQHGALVDANKSTLH